MFHTKLEKTRRYNLYEVLHLSKDASVEDIKKAYKKAALRHHPDKGGDPAKFREIVNAFDILNDPMEKRLYDESEERAYTTNTRKETMIKKKTREKASLDKDFLNLFGCHFGATASIRSGHQGVYKRIKIVEDAEMAKGCKRIFFQHFLKASR